MKTLYDILEVSKTASIEEIKRAYRRLALKYHPDVNKGKDTVQKFKEVVHAYEILSDRKKREEYDRIIGNNASSSQKKYTHQEKKQEKKQEQKKENTNNHNNSAKTENIKKEYFYMKHGMKNGPFSLEHVQNLFLEEYTLVLKLGEKTWKKIQDRQEFEGFWIPTIPTFWNVAYEWGVEKKEQLKEKMIRMKKPIIIFFKRLMFFILLAIVIMLAVVTITNIFKKLNNETIPVPLSTPVETVVPTKYKEYLEKSKKLPEDVSAYIDKNIYFEYPKNEFFIKNEPFEPFLPFNLYIEYLTDEALIKQTISEIFIQNVTEPEYQKELNEKYNVLNNAKKGIKVKNLDDFDTLSAGHTVGNLFFNVINVGEYKAMIFNKQLSDSGLPSTDTFYKEIIILKPEKNIRIVIPFNFGEFYKYGKENRYEYARIENEIEKLEKNSEKIINYLENQISITDQNIKSIEKNNEIIKKIIDSIVIF